MVIRKTYKFRLYPTDSQAKNIDSTIDSCRYLYNQLLHTKKEKYDKEKIKISKFDLKTLASKIVLDTEVYAQAKQNVADRIDKAFSNYHFVLLLCKFLQYHAFEYDILY